MGVNFADLIQRIREAQETQPTWREVAESDRPLPGELRLVPESIHASGRPLARVVRSSDRPSMKGQGELTDDIRGREFTGKDGGSLADDMRGREWKEENRGIPQEGLKKETGGLQKETEELKKETERMRRETEGMKRETERLQKENADIKEKAETARIQAEMLKRKKRKEGSLERDMRGREYTGNTILTPSISLLGGSGTTLPKGGAKTLLGE